MSEKTPRRLTQRVAGLVDRGSLGRRRRLRREQQALLRREQQVLVGIEESLSEESPALTASLEMFTRLVDEGPVEDRDKGVLIEKKLNNKADSKLHGAGKTDSSTARGSLEDQQEDADESDEPKAREAQRKTSAIKLKNPWRGATTRNKIILTGSAALVAAGIIIPSGVLIARAAGHSGSGTSNDLPTGRGDIGGLFADKTQSVAAELRMPTTDTVATSLKNLGIDPSSPSTERLVDDPKSVEETFHDFDQLITNSPFAQLVFPDGRPVSQVVKELEGTNIITTGGQFFVKVANNKITYTLSSDSDPVMGARTSIVATRSFTTINKKVFEDIQIIARVTNTQADIVGNGNATSDQESLANYPAFTFTDQAADQLVNGKLLFSHATPGEDLAGARVYTDSAGGTLTLLPDGTLIYEVKQIPIAPDDVPDLNALAATTSPEGTGAAVIYNVYRGISPDQQVNQQGVEMPVSAVEQIAYNKALAPAA